jgi:hypothetical protein
MDRRELGVFLFTAERFDRVHAALALCWDSTGCVCLRRAPPTSKTLAWPEGHRTLRIIGKGNQPATIPLVPRTARTIDLAVRERTDGPILTRTDGGRLDRRTVHR